MLAIVLINQALTGMGHNPLPFAEDTAREFLSALMTVIESSLAWWTNNSFSKAARTGDELMREIKQTEQS